MPTPTIDINGFSASRDLLADLILLRAPYDNVQWERRKLPPLSLEWKLHAVSENRVNGYDGALFSTQIGGKRQFVVFHQGTNDLGDMPSLARLINGKLPQQVKDAQHFTAEAKALIASRFPDESGTPVLQVGYSLGGPLATICAAADEPIITYETPGIKTLLAPAGIEASAVEGRLLNILSPHSNFINSLGEHVGKVLDAGEKFWNPKKISIANFIKLSVQSHRRPRLSDALKELPTLSAQNANDTGRPTQPWDALREYIADHINDTPNPREHALATAAETIDRLKYDDKFMEVAGKGLDAIMGHIAKLYAQTLGKEKPLSLRTHPQVKNRLVQHRQSGFAARVDDTRSGATRSL